MGKAFRKPRPSPPKYAWYNELDDNCWHCKNRRNCNQCKRCKRSVAEQKERINRIEKQKLRIMKERE